jgi:flagellar export protein FliJ
MIEEMYQSMDETRSAISQAQTLGNVHDLERIRGMEQFLIGQKIRIEKKRAEARELLAIAEQKQDALIHAAQERKIMDNLKERRRVQYVEKMKMLETKELDDLTMVRQARLMAKSRGTR